MKRGFTLVEVLIAISLATILLGVVYFALNAGLESWHYTRDELALEQVVSHVLEEVLEGSDRHFGLRAALEVLEGSGQALSLVPPFTEEERISGNQRTFQLHHYPRPGSGLPIAEVRTGDNEPFRSLPVAWLESESEGTPPWIKTPFELVSGNRLRLTYHPDAGRHPEGVVKFRCDSEEGTLYRDEGSGWKDLGKNPMGVKMADCRFRYYDSANRVIGNETGFLREEGSLVTGVELELEGKVRGRRLRLIGMVTLRNSPLKSGMVILREGMKFPIPNSQNVQALLLTNLTGMHSGDEIQLLIESSSERAWEVTVRFEREASGRPAVAEIRVDYPPGYALFTDRPRSDPELGIDLLSLGPNGLYDYDDDPEVEDVVLMQGSSVTLKVVKMEVKGAALFVKT